MYVHTSLSLSLSRHTDMECSQQRLRAQGTRARARDAVRLGRLVAIGMLGATRDVGQIQATRRGRRGGRSDGGVGLAVHELQVLYEVL